MFVWVDVGWFVWVHVFVDVGMWGLGVCGCVGIWLWRMWVWKWMRIGVREECKRVRNKRENEDGIRESRSKR